MSFDLLDDLTKQVTQYSTASGQLWYVLTFIFRLIIVASLGGAVYDDEQDNFVCNSESPGCVNACYNQFTKLSQIKFWAFQLLAVTGPVVLFHGIASYIRGQLEKIKDTEQKLAEEDDSLVEEHRGREMAKMKRRRKIVGKVKTKRVYDGDELKEIPINNKLRIAYFFTVLMRFAAEVVFLYLTWSLYNYPAFEPDCKVDYRNPQGNGHCYNNNTGLNFLWAEFPYLYLCHGAGDTKSSIYVACFENVAYGGYVPCWTSRPWEKTVFMRYMNVMSAICCCLCIVELLEIPLRYYLHWKNKKLSDYIYNADYYQKSLHVDMTRPSSNVIYSTIHRPQSYENHPRGYVEDDVFVDRPRPQASIARYEARVANQQ